MSELNGFLAKHESVAKPRRQTFFRNFYFPRHIFAPRWKYVVEGMEESIYKKYGIDPNRVPTDAEVGLVAYCFEIDQREAKEILKTRISKAERRQTNVEQA